MSCKKSRKERDLHDDHGGDHKEQTRDSLFLNYMFLGGNI